MAKVPGDHCVVGTHHLWEEMGYHQGPALLTSLAGWVWRGEAGREAQVGEGDHVDSQLA